MTRRSVRCLSRLFAIALLVCFPTVARAQRGCERDDLAVGLSPRGLALEDVSGDGHVDIIATNTSGSSISVLLADGTGRFPSRTDYGSGPYPSFVGVADLNLDGRKDLVVTCLNASRLDIFSGTGSGAFGSTYSIPTAALPWALALADVNNDGKRDAAVVHLGGGVSILLGNGAGGLVSQVVLPTGVTPRGVELRDLNADGMVDLIVANADDATVSVRLGDGNGGFGSAADYPSGSTPWSVAAGDLTGDGAVDLAVANAGEYSVSVFPGDGSGTFGPRVDYVTNQNPRTLTITDVDNDGRLDLAVANHNASSAGIFLGSATGLASSSIDLPVGQQPVAVAAGDIDGDGLADIVTANSASNSVTTLAWRRLAFETAVVHNLPQIPEAVAMRDLNGDNHLDVITANHLGGSVSVLLGDGAGGFLSGASYHAGAFIHSLALDDLNGDGIVDAAIVSHYRSKLSILTGNGAGGFAWPVEIATGTTPYAISTGDLNGDQSPDMAVANYASNTVSLWLTTAPGTFAPRLDLASGAGPLGVLIGDATGDGYRDVVATSSGANIVSIWPGDGTGALGPRSDLGTGNYPFYLTVADMNEDGHIDLLVGNHLSNSVSLFPGTGSGGFGPRSDTAVEDGPTSVTAADYDVDGHLDLVVTCTNAASINLLPGNGDGTFGQILKCMVFGNTSSAAVGNLSEDGRPDLAVVSYTTLPAAETNRLHIILARNPSPIVQGPVAASRCAGDSLSLSVLATGDGLSYEWRRDGAALTDGGSVSGATTAVLSIAPVFPSDSGSYDVRVTSLTKSGISGTAAVTVCERARFLTGPLDVIAEAGSEASFVALVDEGCGTPQLQWLRNGVPLTDGGRIAGSSTTSLSIGDVQESDSGYYSLWATTGCGSRSSAAALLSVTACSGPPVITAQPSSLLAPVGAPAAFTAQASSCTPPTWQWLKAGMPIPGANSNVLTIPSVQPTDDGPYRVAATTGPYTTLSDVATLNVPEPVFIVASHRYVGACGEEVEIYWQTDLPAECLVEYEYSNQPVGTMSQPLTEVFAEATSGFLRLTPPGGFRFMAYRLTATDSGNRTTTTPLVRATLPRQAPFDWNRILVRVIPYPFKATLISPNDAVAVGIEVRNNNCAPLTSRVILDQARLKLASPRDSAGEEVLPLAVAASIPGATKTRLPEDLRFFLSQIGAPTGSSATFRGRLRIESAPLRYRSFSTVVRVP